MQTYVEDSDDEKTEKEESFKTVSKNDVITEMSKIDEKSTSKDGKKKKTEETDEEIAKREGLPEVSWVSILKMNGPEWPYMVTGAFFAIATGAIQPIWAIVFANVLENYSKYNCAYNQDISKLNGNDVTLSILGVDVAGVDVTAIKEAQEGCNLGDFRKNISLWSGMFAVLGIGQFIGYGFLNWMFGISGEYMTTRLRSQSFAKLLRLDMGYFDEPLNSTGCLLNNFVSPLRLF